MRGADLVVRSLVRAGVTRIFALSGNHIMSLFDACLTEGVEIVHVRHEAAAVHMADAQARLTGEPGVALVSAGPGFANALSASYVAMMSESPVVLLSGAAPTHAPEGLAFQPMAQDQMGGFVSRASWTANATERLGHDVARAFRLCRSSRQGPVHVSLPVDLLEAEIESNAGTLPAEDDFHPLMDLLDISTAQQCLKWLQSADRPLILAGPALCNQTGPELLRELEEKVNVPVIGMHSPRGLNGPTIGAFADVLKEADVLVLVQKKLDFTLRMGRPPFIDETCRIIQFDPEIAVLEQTSGLLHNEDQFVLADISDGRAAIERLLQASDEFDSTHENWTDSVNAKLDARVGEREIAEAESLHPVQVGRIVGELIDEDTIFVSDGGEFGQWMQASVRQSCRRIINGPAGAIGGGIPFAIGAAMADSDATVIACVGDGTFGFHPAEIETAVRHQVPFVLIVGNDALWNSEHQIQIREYGQSRTHSCDLSPIDHGQVAASFGAVGYSAKTDGEFRQALTDALSTDKPACIDVRIYSDGFRRP